MIAFVQEYLGGDMERMGFGLDFGHYLIKHYPAMERKDAEMPSAFGIICPSKALTKLMACLTTSTNGLSVGSLGYSSMPWKRVFGDLLC